MRHGWSTCSRYPVYNPIAWFCGNPNKEHFWCPRCTSFFGHWFTCPHPARDRLALAKAPFFSQTMHKSDIPGSASKANSRCPVKFTWPSCAKLASLQMALRLLFLPPPSFLSIPLCNPESLHRFAATAHANSLSGEHTESASSNT